MVSSAWTGRRADGVRTDPRVVGGLLVGALTGGPIRIRQSISARCPHPILRSLNWSSEHRRHPYVRNSEKFVGLHSALTILVEYIASTCGTTRSPTT